MGINFSLEGLDKFIEDTSASISNDTAKSKNDPYSAFGGIVKGIARKYGSTHWIDPDDLEQDLWVKVLTLINEVGYENVTESMVARICWNKAVDVYRYNRRRWDSNCEFIEDSDFDGDYNRSSANYSNNDYFNNKNRLERAEDVVFFKEVIDKFPKGSKERKYVVMKLVCYGVISVEHLDKDDLADLKIPEGDVESDYIAVLGYKSHCPGSWTCKKREIRRVIDEFLNECYK